MKAKNAPKAYPSEAAAITAAKALIPATWAVTAKEYSDGWSVIIDDNEGSIGGIIEGDSIWWYSGGWRCGEQIMRTTPAEWHQAKE